jgi:molybdopterin synthase sulfur carrier subunit
MQDLTSGKKNVSVKGATVREVVNNLEEIYPGIKARLCNEDRIRPNIAVYIDGIISREGMRQRIAEDAEIHFLPAISGGK